MRFRKSIKLFPGVKINLSKTGISASIGPRGATVNLKPGRAARLTTSLPGTGISHTQSLSERRESTPAVQIPADAAPTPIWVSMLRITWSVLAMLATAFIAIAGIELLVITMGGSSKKR